MTDKEKLDAIRAEIHRLVDVRGYDRGMANDLFAFMDSLPNEPISKDLEKEVKDYIYTLPHSRTGIPGGWKCSWKEEEVIKIVKHFLEVK